MGRRNTAPPSTSIAIEDSKSSRDIPRVPVTLEVSECTGTLGIFYRDGRGRGRWCGVAPAHCCWGRPD
eukprot:7328530-Pyramimonas_sp.AAC.1